MPFSPTSSSVHLSHFNLEGRQFTIKSKSVENLSNFCFTTKKTSCLNSYLVPQIEMPTKILIIHALLCFVDIKASVHCSQRSSCCRSIESVSDHALVRHSYELTSGTPIESCAAKCDFELYCYSFNYVISNMTCELNNATRWTDSKARRCLL